MPPCDSCRVSRNAGYGSKSGTEHSDGRFTVDTVPPPRDREFKELIERPAASRHKVARIKIQYHARHSEQSIEIRSAGNSRGEKRRGESGSPCTRWDLRNVNRGDSLSSTARRRDERRRLIYGVSRAFIYAVKDSRVPREIDLIYATPFPATD